MKRSLLLFACVTGCIVAQISAADCSRVSADCKKVDLASWPGARTYSSPPNVTYDIISQPEVPFTLEKVSVQSDMGREVSELTYTVTNKSGTALRDISFLVTFFNGLNQPLGGEVIRGGDRCARDENKNLTASVELRTHLKHYVDVGDRVSLAIVNYRTDTQSWKADYVSIAKKMKQPH
jgi:hypothetical protein